MRKIYALLLGAALTLNGCAWFHKHPVIPAVVTCSGETIPIALVTRVYDDVMTENWIDLAENVVPLLKDGYADLQCVWSYLGTSNPETLPHINAMKAKHADAFKGATSMLRSPGDATPKTRPTATTPDPRSFAVVASGPVACGWRAYIADDTYWTFPRAGGAYQSPATDDSFRFGDSVACATDTPAAKPNLPKAERGVAEAYRAEATLIHVRRETSSPAEAEKGTTGLRAGPAALAARADVLGDSASPAKATYAYAGENPGAALERCDRTCGEHLTSLATVKGCLCWRGKGRSGHWVALREAPGFGLVATR
jgi:hypothetical protein